MCLLSCISAQSLFAAQEDDQKTIQWNAVATFPWDNGLYYGDKQILMSTKPALYDSEIKTLSMGKNKIVVAVEQEKFIPKILAEINKAHDKWKSSYHEFHARND